MKKQLQVNLGNLLISLSEATDISNTFISQHQYRTAYSALEIAKHMNIDAEWIKNVFTAALLHDIGALSVEEKITIHHIEVENDYIHTLRGEVLLEQIPWLRKISKVVRNHHTKWVEWNKNIEEPVVLASQIIYLSDYVERLILRNKYILHQREDIVQAVKKLENKEVHRKIVNSFVEISKREEFWLDLVSPRLYSLLLQYGPFHHIQIGLEDILLISNLFRDLIDFKSRYTATHTTGVAECTETLAKLFGLADIDAKAMKIAGNFHDIGKLMIPNSILEKPGKLTTNEYEMMKCHTYYTYNTLSSIGGLKHIAEWAAYHHEKLDGSGYPFHYSSKEIGTGSRIVAVADIFTAISEDRPYRKGMNKNQIYKILKTQVENNKLDKGIVYLLFDYYDTVSSLVKEKQEKARDFYEKRIVALPKI